jgi:fructose-1,6-bisphosphatase/inositol monophosphatase family enzyme
MRSRLMAAYSSDDYLGEEMGTSKAVGDSGIWVVDLADEAQSK